MFKNNDSNYNKQKKSSQLLEEVEGSFDLAEDKGHKELKSWWGATISEGKGLISIISGKA